jgi:membrane-associated phospholipid phosphatase
MARLAVGGTCAGLLVLLALTALTPSVPGVDRSIASYVAAHRTGPVDMVMAIVSLVGGGAIMSLLAGCVAVGLVSAGRVRSAVYVTAAYLTAALLAPLLRVLFMRPGPPGDYRPLLVIPRSLDLIWIGIAVGAAILLWRTRWRVNAILAAILFGLILGVDHVGVRMAATGDELDSFPSGHLARAAVVIASLTLVAFRSRWRTALVVAGGLLLVALTVSRVYLGAHYPSDVLAGALVGMGVAAWVSLVPLIDPLAGRVGPIPQEHGPRERRGIGEGGNRSERTIPRRTALPKGGLPMATNRRAVSPKPGGGGWMVTGGTNTET